MQPFKRTRDKVAFVGFSETSRHLAPFDDPEWEIWGLNEEYNYPWMKRFDRWFQLHPEYDFNRKDNQNDPNHPLWLRNETATCMACLGTTKVKNLAGTEQDCPWCKDGIYVPTESRKDMVVYMQDGFDYVPGSAKYPLKELTEHLCKRIGRPYFTSTPAFMLALAIAMGYKTIGLYGLEMGSDTEYHYQRPCFEYWMGQADGRGVNIVIPDGCNLNSGLLYGYENMKTGYRQDLEMRKAFLKTRIDGDKVKMYQAEGRLKLAKEIKAKPEWTDEEIGVLVEDATKEHAFAQATVNFKKGAMVEVEQMTGMYDAYFRSEIKGTNVGEESTRKWVMLDYNLSGSKPDASQEANQEPK